MRNFIAAILLLSSCATPNASQPEMLNGCWQSKDLSEKLTISPRQLSGRKVGAEFYGAVEITENGSTTKLSSSDIQFQDKELRFLASKAGDWIETISVTANEVTLTTKSISPNGNPGEAFPPLFKVGRQRTLSRIACPTS